MASLQINHNGDPNWHLCGAVLVSHRYVATNAHCVTEFPSPAPDPASMFHLRIGSLDRTSGGVVAGVEQVLVNPDWNWGDSPVVSDIALLRLDTYVQLQPKEIASSIRPNAGVRLEGWGVTEPDGEGPLPLMLQALDTRLLLADRCAAGGITAGEICVSNKNGTDGPCFGDSGSPAQQRIPGTDRWAGIGGASRETTEFCGTGPGIYTDWSYFRTWMYNVMRTGVVPPRTAGGPARHPDGAPGTGPASRQPGLHWTIR